MPINLGMLQSPGQSPYGQQPDQGQQSQQDPSNINFGILQPPRTQSGVISQPSGSGGGGGNDGLGSLLQGLGQLAGAFNKQPSNQTQSPNTGPNPSYAPQSQQSSLEQTLFGNASKMQGMNQNNPVLQQYLQKANPGLNPTVTPWCAGFVGSVLNASGEKGTGSLAARSYLNYGQPTDKPTPGDIVVLSRGSDPNLGHVGFYAGTDPNGNVMVLGGNHNGAVGMGTYPSSRVLGFRVPPNGQQVAQIAKQNNIQNPQQLANITRGSQVQEQTNPAIPVIKQFEGFDHQAKWDVNAYRVGYGSDTITRPDGTIQKVRPGMTVSQEDAERDLTRRTQEFQQTAIKQVGSDKWNSLPQGAQAALTSLTYNYGSLPKPVVEAIKTGSTSVIAGAVRSLGGANRGVNRDRRNQEADMIVQSAMGPQAMNNQPPAKFFDQNQQNPPQIPQEKMNDLLRSYDQGRDDYAQTNSKPVFNMAMNSRAMPGTGQVPIRNMRPEDLDAIMRSQGQSNVFNG